jgi:hypothetical protein
MLDHTNIKKKIRILSAPADARHTPENGLRMHYFGFCPVNPARSAAAVITGSLEMGSYGRYAVIRDPAGAVAALIEPVQESGARG